MAFSFRALLFSIGAMAILSFSCILDVVLGSSGQQPSATQAAQAPSTANLYCTPSGTWIGPVNDGPAKMPIECMYTSVESTPSPGEVRGPHSTTEEVQADINAAECGDKVLIASGSSLGRITLPAKKCDNKHWITIASTGINSPNFPAEGVRMTPCWSGVASMPNRPAYPCPKPKVLTFKIVTPNAESGIATRGGDHYRIIGAEITRVSAGGAAIYALVDLSSSKTQSNHIIFDRSWFEGIEGTFPSSSQATDTSTTRGLYLGQSNHVAVIDSYFTNFYDTSVTSANGNTDAQCIAGGLGSVSNSGWGVYKFVNNHCEASGEGILLGGGGGPSLTPAGCTILVNCNVDTPTDLEVRENYFFKPLQWNGNTTVPGARGWPVVKNGFEMKTGVRALFEGNVIENCWYNAQGCASFTVAPINQQSGGPTPRATCPTCVVQDFTYRYNYSYNVAYGMGVYAFLPGHCSTCQPQGAMRISIHDNLIGDNLNMGNLRMRSSGDAMELYAGRDTTNQGLAQLNDIDISHNTFVRAIRSLAVFGGDAPGQMHNWTMQNNIWPYGNYGVGPVGNARGCDSRSGWGPNDLRGILSACVTNWKFDHNAVFNWQGGSWPAGNSFFKNPEKVQFVDYRDGNSDFNPGNYALQPSSPLHNAGTDGKDLGADIGTLVTRIAGVRQ
jgi:hypothetical protein